MPGKWEVMSNWVGSEKMYIVGRRKDESKPLHSGNVEYRGSYTTDRTGCVELARELNKEGKDADGV